MASAEQAQQMMTAIQDLQRVVDQQAKQLASMTARAGGHGGDVPLIDTRGIAKPPNFEGEPTKWLEWCFKLKAFVGAGSPMTLKEMETAGVPHAGLGHRYL